MMSLRLDPRTKVFLILLCVFCAMFAPNLYFQLALVGVIGVLAVLSGKWRYAMRGFVVYALICVFTVWSIGVMSGTWRTMFVAFLGLVHKVYACGMLAGLVIGTTKVGEFLSAMARLHVPKKLTIPLAVMLRYLPTIHEDWRYIKDAMCLRDVSPSFWGFLRSPAMTVNCIYVPLLTAASKAADALSVASVMRGIENPNPRTCLVKIRMRAADFATMVLCLRSRWNGVWRRLQRHCILKTCSGATFSPFPAAKSRRSRLPRSMPCIRRCTCLTSRRPISI